MADHSTGTRTVKDLDGYHFNVPRFQRGYRWTEHEVRALLDDLYSFSVKRDAVPEQSYCLQPVVVRHRDGKKYDVIDGQQRLTTLLLMLKYAASREGSPVDGPYQISYETRPRSQDFLDDLPKEVTGLSADAVPDFFYMREAWKTIKEWAEEASDGVDRVAALAATVREHVMLIWYEAPVDVDGPKLFRRLNVGRIPLTNAELIKALLLTRASASDRTRIAYEWDQIEHALQNDDLWYFLASGDDDGISNSTRIDLLFDTWAGDESKSRRGGKSIDPSDPFSSFRKAEERLADANGAESRESISMTIWDEIKDIFSHFMYWYTDFELYHKLGYLMAIGIEPAQLFSTLDKLDKAEVLGEVNKRIKSSIGRSSSKSLTESGIYELTVTDDKKLIVKLHLLFNVQTILAEGEKGARFSFKHYKQQRWDVEHIHAVSERMPRSGDPGIDDLAEERKLYMQALSTEIDAVLGDDLPYTEARAQLDVGLSDRIFESDEKAVKLMKQTSIQTALEELATRGDFIGNTVLLDSSTNRSYGNAGFGQKRREIIKQSRGVRFIPPVTRNVFLGYYRDSQAIQDRWTEDDQRRYVKEDHGLVDTLRQYLDEDEQ